MNLQPNTSLIIFNRGTVHINTAAIGPDEPRIDLLSTYERLAPASDATHRSPTASLNVPRFLHEPSSGIVIDRERNLMWSRAPLSSELKSFADAEAACAACRLGEHSDWRLPTREELQSLVDYTRFNPAIDPEAFPETPANYFWSSSPVASDPDVAWVVGFHGGYVGLDHRNNGGYVRAVRSVPASQ